MTARSIRIAAASLVAIAVAGCTTSGVGTGQSATGNIGATFTWRETGGTQGMMVAQLSNGQVYQGPMFQITQESRVSDYGGLWNGWGPYSPWGRYGYGGFPWGGWSRYPYGYGWGGWGPWGPNDETITHYTGQVLANLQGPGGFMRCRFTLMSPSSGMAGGGVGQCQLPTGTLIHAQFAPHRRY
jgi:hypothetical protein